MHSGGVRLLCLSAFLLTTALAPAQTSRIERPLSLEVGAFLPDNNRTDFPKDVGVYAALGYSFHRVKAVTLSAQVRGAYQLVTLGGGGDDGSDDSSGDLTILSAFINARLQPSGAKAFAGLGLGVGRANVVDAKDHTGLLVAFEAGYDLSPRTYVVARYETSGPDTLCGATLGLGFRF